MFTSSPKLFLLLTVAVVTNPTISADALCDDEPVKIAARELQDLATTVVKQKNELEKATHSLDGAKVEEAALHESSKAAEMSLAEAEKIAAELVKQLAEAQRKLDDKPTDTALKAAVTAAESKAATTALKARQEVVARDEATRKLKGANRKVAELQSAVEAATDKWKQAEQDLNDLTATLISPSVAVESIAKAAKSAEAAAKSVEAAGKSVELAAKSSETAAMSVETVTKSAETAARSVETVAKSAKAAAASVELATKSSETAAKSAEAAANSAAIAAKSAADTVKVIAAAAGSLQASAPATSATIGADADRDSDSNREQPAPCQAHAADSRPDAACKPIDPFVRLPMVTTITQAKDIVDFCQANEKQDENRCDCSKPYAYDYRFDATAHFPLPSFGLRGEESEREGAIIYEGMRFALSADGRYQVRFVVETPGMPVTMRLQLTLEDEGTRNRYSLTLPPISIPEPDKPKHTSQQRKVQPVYANIQIVHHEGYLPVLTQSSSNIRVVRRTGSARFGFGVDLP